MTWGTKSNVPFVFGSLSQAPSAKVSGYRTGARACSEPNDLQLGPGSRLGTFLRSQPNLELLELHSEKTSVHKSRLSLPYLTALGCPPQFLDASHSTTRLRLNFQKPTELPLSPFFNLGSSEINQLKRVLDENQTRQMKSLALFLWKKESKFSEIIRVIASNHIYIQHLEIHQSLPIQVRS